MPQSIDSMTPGMARASGNPPTNGLAAPRASVLPLLGLWLPAAVATVAAKPLTLDEHGEQLLLASLGRGGDDGFTASERWSFVRGDLLFVTIVVPLVVALAAQRLSARWMAAFVALSSSVTLALVYTETEFYREVGRFQSIELIVDGLLWGGDNPDLAGHFLPVERIVALAVMIVIVALGAWRVAASARRLADSSIQAETTGTASRQRYSPWSCAHWTLIAVVGAANLVAWTTPIESTAWHKSLFRLYFENYADVAEWDADAYLAATPEELATSFRELTRTPEARHDERYFGRATDCDVLLFVMETGPAACLGGDGSLVDDRLADMPTLRRLRERSFVSSRHLTTYPYTSRAVFSILSSWYPASAAKDFIEQTPDMRTPGLVRSLAARGYASAVYLPLPLSFRSDERMFRSLGFEQIYVAPRQAFGEDVPTWKQHAAHDESALAAWRGDLERNLRSDRRSVTLLLPQIGHAPWPDVSAEQTVSDNLARGRALMALQDRWLGEIVATLERHGRLERSIIVVTADHGLRNRGEDADLPLGLLSDRMMRVPLFVFAPQALHAAEPIDWTTSHVDIVPTVLDLIGVEAAADRGRTTEQGRPIWDERLRDRVALLWGRHYTGADGFAANGEFSVWNHELDVTTRGSRLPPRVRDVLRRGQPADLEVRTRLDAAAALQHAWVRRQQENVPQPTHGVEN